MNKGTYTFGKRLMALLLCIVMVAGSIPVVSVAVEAPQQSAYDRVVDESTKDKWKDFFGDGTGNISTENAGGVWTDKSVFTDATAFENIEMDSRGNAASITMKNEKSFLVALSAMASNMTITGQASTPTDTMLVLDVSGSMNDNSGNNDVAEELVIAANSTIDALLKANPNNRVGVVLYSGSSSSNTNNDAAILVLPLGRYETSNDNEYLNYIYEEETNWWGQITSTTETIGLDADVKIEGTSNKPTAREKEVAGATYIQKGLIEAMEQFTATSNETTVNGVTCKPVLVLMSDGAPTLATTNFTDPGQYNLGNGQSSSTSAAQGFVTQLTAAYTKQQIEEKYGTEALFYTVGLGVTGNTVATSVLDPANSDSSIDEFWTRYNAAATGGTVTVQGSGNNARRVTKIAETLAQNYVDQYIEVDGSTTDLAQGLIDAFEQIVSDISLQSKYYPTLISDNEDLSGYVSFVDRIGAYMSVTDVKGILLHDRLFSGADMASHFAEGSTSLGTVERPTALGDELVFAVRERLGLDGETARTLIGLAYQYGQLSYTNEENFSNYIGWYADADGKFVGFWHENATTQPDTAVYTVKSYGYLGDTDTAHGVAASDMMYATVQVRHNIETNEELVTFAVPAALIPIITYEVTLDENGGLEELEQAGADYPIRLLYEVSLDSHINELTVNELVTEEYLNVTAEDGTKPMINADGTINFYTNKFDVNGNMGYNTSNAYSYFYPSRENDKYYYLEDAPVYADQQGTLYTGSVHPEDYSDTLYRSYLVYEKIGGEPNIRTVYRPLSAEARATAVRDSGADTWHIPDGNVHVNMQGYIFEKEDFNITNTLDYYNHAFVDVNGHNVNDTGHRFVVGATLGNNGKLTITPATGIKLTKAMAEGVTAGDTLFTFTIQNLIDAEDDNTYNAVLELADGTQSDLTELQFTNGSATVQLQAGQAMYITGLIVGDQFSITETETAEHIVESVNGTDGSNSVTVTVADKQLAQAAFINTERGKGSLIISKDVNYPNGFAPTADHNDKVFTVEVTFTGDTIGMSVPTGAEQSGNVYTLRLKDGDSVTFGNIPEGVSYTVQEINLPAGYNTTPEYRYSDNSKVIGADDTDQVHVVNAYEPAPVSPNVTIQGTKEVVGGWPDGAEFTVQLYMVTDFASGDASPVEGKTATVTADKKGYTIDMSSLQLDKAMTYYFRIVEEIPDPRHENMAYDQTYGLLSIRVGDANADGALEVQDVSVYQNTGLTGNATDGWIITKNFTNKVTTGIVRLPVEKHVVDAENNHYPDIRANITFALFDSPDAETPTYYMVTDSNGKATITVPVTKAELGTEGKIYYMREIAPAVANRVVGMTYDETWKYAIHITWDDDENSPIVNWATTDSDGNVNSSYTLFDPDDTAFTFSITNTYTTGVKSSEIELSGTKHMTGDTTEIGDRTFSFSVYNATAAFVTQGDPIQTVTSNGSAITFKPITFDSEGMKYLVIKENATTHGGVVIDSSEYRVTVLVEKYDDNGTTKLRVAEGYPTIVKYGSTTHVNINQINFTNTYTHTDTTYTISGTKELEGRTLLNEEFTFVLTEDANKNGEADEGETQRTTKNTVDSTFHNGTFTFGAFTYTEPGEYHYLVSEQKNGDSAYGIVYDEHVFKVVVTVTDNGVGQLVASATVDGSNTKPIAFKNTYKAANISADIPGTKTLNGKVLGEGDFEFELYHSDEDWNQGAKIAQTDPVKNGPDGSFAFDAITYENAGTYYYLVKEVNGGETIDGVTYDATVFRVRVEVTDDLRGQLHTRTVVFDDNDIPQIGVEFVNEYNVTGTAKVVLSGTKTLTGRNKALEDGEFTFELYTTNESYNTDGISPVSTTNTGNGYSLQLDYDADDLGQTFYYVLKEKNAGEWIDGVTHSTVAYNLKVEIQDDGFGGLKPVVTCSATDVVINQQGTESTVTGLNFTNTYSAAPAKYTLAATKEYDGLTMRDFQFTLTGMIGADEINETKTLDKSTKKVTFSELTFPVAGDYEFTVVEVENSLWGFVIWDTNEYTVKINVTDNDEGQLVIDSTDVVVTSTSGKTDLSFHNGYNLNDGEVTFLVTKTMDPTGDRTDPKGFTFELYENDLSGQPIDTATSDSTGAAAFDKLTFTKDDLTNGTATRTYYIKEQVPSQNPYKGVTYDETVYTVVVTLTDNEEGQITVSYTVNSTDVNEDTYRFAFENKYEHAPVDMVIPGSKELVGGGLEADKFTFKLYQTNSTYSIEGLTPIKTVTNRADGSFDFNASNTPELHYTDEDTHYYVLVEDNTDPIADTLYDSIVYKLKVVVTDDGEGQLQASLTDSAGNAINSTNPIVFRNVPYEEITEKEVEKTSEPGITVDGKQVNAGDELVYTISYHNYLRQPTDVQIVDTIPEHTTFVSADNGGVITDGVITWNFTNVAPDADIEVSFKVTVDDVNTIFSNEATVRDSVNTYTTNEVFTHTVEDQLIKDVFLSGTTVSIDGNQVEVNDKLTYTITFHNPSADQAILDIEDRIPAHTTYTVGSATDGGVFDNGVLTWEDLVIEPWSSKTVSFEVTVDDANVIVQNQATAWDGTNGYTSNMVYNHTVEDITQKEVALESKPEVKIDGEKVNVGDILRYTISYINITGKDVTVTITDKLPAYTSFVAADNGGTNTNGTVEWTLTVPAWETVEVNLQVKVEGAETIYTNTATVVEGENEYTTNPVTNHTVEEITEKDVFFSGSTTSIDGEDVKVGQLLTYTIDYVNVTGKNATVTITDKLPSGTTFVSATSGGKYADGVVTWTLDVPAWQSITVELTVKVTAVNDAAKNQATVVEGTNEYKTNVVTNELYQIQDIKVDVTVSKTVNNTGSEKIGPEDFSFVLENAATGEKLTGKSDKNGLVVYGLTFTEKDIGKTYTYKLSEVNTGIEGMTYDTAVYTYTVTVGEDSEHKLTARLTVNGKDAEKLTAAFTNTYAPVEKPIVTPPMGDEAQLMLWFSLLAISAVAIMALVILGKKKRA